MSVVIVSPCLQVLFLNCVSESRKLISRASWRQRVFESFLCTPRMPSELQIQCHACTSAAMPPGLDHMSRCLQHHAFAFSQGLPLFTNVILTVMSISSGRPPGLELWCGSFLTCPKHTFYRARGHLLSHAKHVRSSVLIWHGWFDQSSSQLIECAADRLSKQAPDELL